MKDKVTIIVNSSDGFEDCWNPFFLLLEKYWPDIDFPILLNTEFKDFHFKNLDIHASKVHNGVTNRKLTWSECLIGALDKVKTPLVLYMQEDYFLDAQVQNKIIVELASLMLEKSDIKYIGLTDIGNCSPFKKYDFDNRLWVVGNGKYRISTQAALWDKETLKSYLIPNENGWMFEIFGTQRSKVRKDLFLTTNRDLYSRKENPIITYEHTGIIKGQWHREMPKLFADHKIVMDFSKRGIYKQKLWIFRKIETLRKLMKHPKKLLTYYFTR